MNQTRKHTITLTALIVAATALGACSKRDDDRTAGQKLDGAVATVEQKTETAKAEASKAADTVAEKFDDASITAGVNAELAKDDKLSALKINVDTAQGAVVLKGTAPDVVSRERATALAASVKGVTSVDNQLEVRS